MKHKPTFIPAIIWFIIVTILLTLPGQALPSANWLNVIWFDKWVHIGLFSIMVVLWCWGMGKMNYPANKLKIIFIVICLGGIVYGAGMEFVQKYFIPNRSFEVADIIADSTGCLAGVLFSIYRYIKK